MLHTILKEVDSWSPFRVSSPGELCVEQGCLPTNTDCYLHSRRRHYMPLCIRNTEFLKVILVCCCPSGIWKTKTTQVTVKVSNILQKIFIQQFSLAKTLSSPTFPPQNCLYAILWCNLELGILASYLVMEVC